MGNTSSEILARLKAGIPDTFDTSDGSFFHDAEAPIAIELEKTYQRGDEILDNAFLSTAQGDFLKKRGSDFGTDINEAKQAKCNVEVKGIAGAIFQVAQKVASETVIFENLNKIEFQSSPFVCTLDNTTNTITSGNHAMKDDSIIQLSGTLPEELSTGTNYFLVNRTDNTFQISASEGGSAIEFSSDGSSVQIVPVELWKDAIVQATAKGVIGNVPIGSITKFPVTLTGIKAVRNLEASEGGLPEEELEDYRDRALERLQNKGASGNIYDYREWVQEVDGVGAVRVRPLINASDVEENGNVQLVIVGTDFREASPTLCSDVEEYINGATPEEMLRPIGATINCKSAVEVPINIVLEDLDTGGNDWLTVVKPIVEETAIDYFAEIALVRKTGETEYNRDVNYPQLNSRILAISEIVSYTAMKINGDEATIEVLSDQVPVIGTVTKTP